MEWVLALIVAALLAALATWLVLRTKTATLQERLNARDVKIAELDTRLTDQLAVGGEAQAEMRRAAAGPCRDAGAAGGGAQGGAGKAGDVARCAGDAFPMPSRRSRLRR